VKDPHARDVAAARPRGSLAHNVVEFCRLLKANGIPLPAGSARVALAALREIPLTDRHSFRSALRISLLQDPQAFALFNTLFAAYWRFDDDGPAPRDADATRKQADDETQEPDADNDAAEQSDAALPPSTADDEIDDQFGTTAPRGARIATRRRGIDNTFETAELDRLAAALAAELALTRSRRKHAHRRRHTLDHRRLLRRSLRYGGVPLELAWRRPRIARARLLILCDVSRSMAPHAQLLLKFANAVAHHAWRVEVFLFASELVRVTNAWRETEWRDLTAGLTSAGGGTRLGDSLETLQTDYAYCLTGNKVTTIILSDGLDAGDPVLVARNMGALARRSHRVIWLNPLLTTDGYEPIARGMAAALPFVDVFAPAEGIASLWRLVRVLREAA
jgi:uncharacterized protein with von Willebrand factor type A (vWA) domain